MTKRSDMATRYAAAHARREQRRTQATTRNFLPLAEQSSLPGGSGTEIAGRTSGGGALLSNRSYAADYTYLKRDLIRTGVLMGALFAVMIILSLVIHV